MEGNYGVLRGGGPFGLKKGQVGEHAQLATVLATALRELEGYDAPMVLKRYAEWLPRGLGADEHFREVMTEVTESGFPRGTAGRRVWMRGYRRVAHNGSLARTAPIGVAFHKEAQTRAEVSMLDSSLTHFDPRCQLACAAFNGAIAHALTGGEGLQKDGMFTAAYSGLTLASAVLARDYPEFVHEITLATAFLREDLVLARQDDPRLYWPEMHMLRKQDHVRVGFRLAFWVLEHAPSFEAGIVDVIHRGGDSDANGAITGALLGAFHGEDTIPSDWHHGVLSALSPRDGPLWLHYHPRILLQLVPEEE